MTDRFLITPHSTTLTYRIGEGGNHSGNPSLYRVRYYFSGNCWDLWFFRRSPAKKGRA